MSSSPGPRLVAALHHRSSIARALLVASATSLLLLSAVAVASGQLRHAAPMKSPRLVALEKRQSDPIDASTVADPTATVPGSTPAPQADRTPTTTRQPIARLPATRASTAVEDAPPVPTNVARRTSGFGNAALQSHAAKKREARADCVPNRPPISAMLGLGGSVTLRDGTPWGWLEIALAAAASLFAIIAFRLRRRHGGQPETRPPRGVLETVATLVAVFGGIAGLAVQFFPAVAGDHPAPEAAMAVREVHARITRGEYASKTGAGIQLSETDKREVGDVIWLEIDLRGYGGLQPQLQYGLYDPDLGGALLPGTAKQVPMRDDGDAQRSYVPIWVGYPKSQRFQAQFRLLEHGRVRQMTSTGEMRASRYRYACSRSS
jgi:hypothetical protein